VTPTLAGVEDLATITSSPVPDPDLYRLSIDQALEAGKPLVVVFATPAYCKTATCGPQVQVVSQLKDRFSDQANFIHVEVFENPHLIEAGRPAGGFVPAVGEWNLPTEPWTFVLDGAGRVRAKFEVFTTAQELARALEEVLRDQR
jgi:peroxiredoxin